MNMPDGTTARIKARQLILTSVHEEHDEPRDKGDYTEAQLRELKRFLALEHDRLLTLWSKDLDGVALTQ